MKKFFTMMLMLFTTISIAVAQPAMMTKGQVDNSTQIDSKIMCQDFDAKDPVEPEIWFFHQAYAGGAGCPAKTHYEECGIFEDPTIYEYWAFSCINSEQFTQIEWFCDDTIVSSEMFIEFSFSERALPDVLSFHGVQENGEESWWYCHFQIDKEIISPIPVSIYQSIENKIKIKWDSDDVTLDIEDVLVIEAENPFDTSYFSYTSSPHCFFNLESGFMDDFPAQTNDESYVYAYEIEQRDTCSNIVTECTPGVFITLQSNKIQLWSIFDGNQSNYQFHLACHNGDPTTSIVLDSYETSVNEIPLPTCNDGYEYYCVKLTKKGDNSFIDYYSNSIYNPTLSTGETPDNTTFTVYPNPSSNGCNIEGFGVLTISNMLGQTILEKEINGKECITPHQGIYIFKLNTKDDKLFVKKVIIE